MKACRTPPSTAVLVSCLLLLAAGACAGEDGARRVQTPYTAQKVVFDFYFDDPEKINAALYWIRSLMNPLMDSPYDYAPESLDIKVVIHGTEIVALARRNEAKYHDAVERMRYYASLGVQFKVCGIAAQDYGYRPDDFYDFVDVVPSAITELAHWQLQGYALITPQVMEKRFSIEEIR
jgi:intracellular sulfur oxidation DsrE/DsrF family protein